MASSKTILAIGLAAATLVVFVVVIAMGGALRAGLASWPGIGVAVLAIAAFAVPRPVQILSYGRKHSVATP